MQHIHFKTIDSTNDEAKRRSNEVELPFVVTADTQSAGRGREGRSWYSDSDGGLYFSLAVKPKCFDPAHYQKHSLEVAHRVSDIVSGLSGVETEVEWPNDIICKNRKVGGILIESLAPSCDPLPRCVIIGVGLNLNQDNFPSELDFVAISLYQITGAQYDKSEFITQLTEGLADVFEGN